MKKVIRIDEDDFFVEDVILEDDKEMPSDCVDIECKEGFYKPKWDGTQWIEGLTQDEINTIKNQLQIPTTEERLSSIEDVITMLMGV